MRRDRERREWEREAEEELEQDQPVGPVHYQELRAQEVRTHGAGYYAFSVDEEQRREQIGLLNKLREQVCQHKLYALHNYMYNNSSTCALYIEKWLAKLDKLKELLRFIALPTGGGVGRVDYMYNV